MKIVHSAAVMVTMMIVAPASAAPVHWFDVSTSARVTAIGGNLNYYDSASSREYEQSGPTAAHIVTDFTAPNAANDLDGNKRDAVGRATASVNLAAGKVGVYASSNQYAGADASASFGEQMKFTIAGASADTVTPLTFRFAVEGDVSHSGPYWNTGGAFMDFYLSFGQTNIRVGQEYADIRLGLGSLEDINFYQSATGLASYSITADGGSRYIDAVYNVYGSEVNFALTMSLRARSSGSAVADYAHTATIDLSVPSHVTWTSSSGIFLTESNDIDVPEPGVLGLLGLGAMGLIAARRHRRRS